MLEMIKLFVVASLLVATVVTAKTIQLNPGESASIGGTQVICNGGVIPSATPVAPEDRCDGFYSEGSCQNATIGQVCVFATDRDRRGVCVRSSNFGGKANCVCK